MNDTILLSSTQRLPLSNVDISMGRGYALFRTNAGYVTGVACGLAGSAISDRELEFILAVRNCIYGLDNEGTFYLDNEGLTIYVELLLYERGVVLCSVDLVELDVREFIDGRTEVFPYAQGSEVVYVNNDTVGEHQYVSFEASIVQWCESVITMREQLDEMRETNGAPTNTSSNLDMYVDDLVVFMDLFNEKGSDDTIASIVAEIKASGGPPSFQLLD